MDQKTDKRKESRRREAPASDTPVEESLLIRQRLRNLCELAISIGQKQGLLGNPKYNDSPDSEGSQDVADKGNVQDRKAALPGKHKTSQQSRRQGISTLESMASAGKRGSDDLKNTEQVF